MRTLSLLTLALFLSACGDDSTGTPTGPSRDVGGTTTDIEGDIDGDATALPDTGGTEDTTETQQDTGDRDASAVDIFNECGEIEFVADGAYRAADIIWVIDGSESMDDEIEHVRSNINTFVSRIDESGIDVRMVMVASKETRTVNKTEVIPFPPYEITAPVTYHGICVPEPLSAAPGCPDTDNPPLFVHPDVNVYSTDALERLMVDAYPMFRNNLRRHARTHIVVVTDDSSSKDAAWFRDQTRLVDPPGFSLDYMMHSIIALGSCGNGSGAVYESMSFDTGGVVQDVCRSDWTPIFDKLLEGVVGSSELPCAYGLPEPGEDFVLIPSQVNVFFTPSGGERVLVPNVDNASACGEGQGWYYDNPADPRAVYVCPTLCGDAALGSVDMTFGCDTVKR